MYTALGAWTVGSDTAFDEAVELAAHHGFDGIYVDLAYLRRVGPAAAVQILYERGLRAAGWGLPLRLDAPDADYRRALQQLPEAADLCSRAAATRCSTWLMPASNEATYDQAFGLLVERVGEVGRILAEHDVRLGLEFVGPKTGRVGKAHELIHTLEGALDLCRAVGLPNVGLLLDCWHVYTSGASVDAVRKLAADQVVDVHVSDAPLGVERDEQRDGVRMFPGETGVIDGKRFLQNLRRIGYDGPVMAEPMRQRVQGMSPDETVGALKEGLDRIWPESP